MAKGFFNNDLVGQSDMFSIFGLAQPTPEEPEESEAAAEDEATEDAKDSKPKSAKGAKKHEGPVNVIGCGWSGQFGEAGKKYTAKQIIKLAYEAGYKEVAAATIKETDSDIYVVSMGAKGTDEITAVKDGTTVILGHSACTLSAEQCKVTADEFSVYDVNEKFVALAVDFAGCTLTYNASAGVAVPSFEKKATIGDGTYRIWSDAGIKEISGCDIKTFYPEKEYTFYEGGSGVLFAQPEAPKNAVTISVKAEDLGLTEVKTSKVEEKFALPLRLCLSNYNQVINIDSTMFGGKEKVEKDDIISFLKPTYKAFRSSSRKFDLVYNKGTNELAVMIMSGEKGAPLTEVSFLSAEGTPTSPYDAVKRVEKTPLGVFEGQVVDGEVVKVSFTNTLEKIPGSILDEIIDLFKEDITKENIVQIFLSRDNSYYIVRPECTASKVSVVYTFPYQEDATLIATVHSHNTMRAFFSKTDDADEDYTGIFGVIGRLDGTVEVSFRAGMEGVFCPILAGDLFEGGVA